MESSRNFFRPIKIEPRTECTQNLLVLCLDFDGCLDDPESWTTFILAYVLPHLDTEQELNEILVCIGSLRQSVALDILNARRNAEFNAGKLQTCAILGAEFCSQLKESIDNEYGAEREINVDFCPLLASDVYNQLFPGTTYEAMKSACYGSLEPKEEFVVKNLHKKPISLLAPVHIAPGADGYSFECADVSKIMLLYMFVHHISVIRPFAKKMNFRFIDDRKDLIDGAGDFFSGNTETLPSFCSFQGLQFIAHRLMDRTEIVAGTGFVNRSYAQDLWRVARMVDDPRNAAHVAVVLTSQLNVTDQSMGFVAKSASIRGPLMLTTKHQTVPASMMDEYRLFCNIYNDYIKADLCIPAYLSSEWHKLNLDDHLHPERQPILAKSYPTKTCSSL